MGSRFLLKGINMNELNFGKDLISQKMLEKSDSGKCFVPYRNLLEYTEAEILRIDNYIRELSRANPEFTFYTTHDPIADGVKISWERTGILKYKGQDD